MPPLGDFFVGVLVGAPIGFLIGLYLRDEIRWLAGTVRHRWGRKDGT